MTRLTITAAEYPAVARLVDSGQYTPEQAIAKVRADNPPKRSRRPRQPKELGRPMEASDYHALITEQAFTTQTIKLAQGYGWFAWHDQDSRKNASGLPDLILIHPDHGVVWCELKTEIGRLRTEQARVLSLLRQAGQRAFVARPRHRDALERLFRGEDVPDTDFEIPSDRG